MARPPRVEDPTMMGAVPPQRMEVNYNAVTAARLMHQEQFARMYHGGPQGLPRGDGVRAYRPETTAGIADGQSYASADRDHYIPSSDRDFGNNSALMLSNVDRNEGAVDEGQRFVNGGSHVSSVVNASTRVLDWTGNEQPSAEMGDQVDYRDMEERDGGSSGGSQSEGSDEDDEEDGDMDGEGEDIEPHQGVTRLGDHGLPAQRGYETLSNIQIEGMEANRHEVMAGLQSSEGFQKAKFDRDLSSQASTSSAPALGMFLSQSTIPFLNSFSSSPSVGPIIGHGEPGPTGQNGTSVATSGIGTSSAYYRESSGKETNVRDTYAKENQSYNHEQVRVTHGSPVPEAVPAGSEAGEHYNSHSQSTTSLSQKESENQIVAVHQGKSYDPMEMPLRSALTDPLTGALMDDATILLCGHSFGSESLQRVLENNACISCGAAAKREDMAPNHALQSVVQAYKREEQRWKENASKAAKRRRERLDQRDKHNSNDLAPLDFARHKGVQFPYKVNDKVLIKGNKRTPERFVGRLAIITTQCLNGWYVVRTLDNGESVKLQYRSLAKASEQPPSKEMPAKTAGSNWL